MGRLVILRLNGNKIRDLYPLHSLPAVRFLELQDNMIKDLRPLGDIPTLMHLDVARNQLVESACVCGGLRKLKKLASLILQGEHIYEPSSQSRGGGQRVSGVAMIQSDCLVA